MIRAGAELPPPSSLVIIGASTGGPRILADLVGLLPKLRACLLIVQHFPKFINASFVRTLSRCTPMEVRLAEDGDALQDGQILVAPSEVHCQLVHNRFVRLVSGPPVNFVRPSIDVTMQSVSRSRPKLIGVLLTGMGKDGAAGMAHLKRLGALTIAQNEATCAVYGMPAEAVRLGCVDHQLPPDRIAELLTREISGRPGAE